MGSPCEVQFDAEQRSLADAGVRIAIAEVERLEARYSRYRDTSLLSEINRAAARGVSIEVDDETAGLLDYAETCWRQSDGLFDITSGLLRRAWRFDGGQIPEAARVESLLDRIGWQKLSWQRPVLSFGVPDMELDLGGVVKEYAADRVTALCLEAGLRHGLVNLGGDIRVIGPRRDGGPWRIGIRDPRRPGKLIHTVSLQRGALASSGDYERCIEIDGVRHGHVLSPRTGWPVRTLASVSVVADLCVVAGSAATIALLRESEGPAWLDEMGLLHLFVGVDGVVGGSLLGRA
jgi:thiamine biosynthesis lipoprotein